MKKILRRFFPTVLIVCGIAIASCAYIERPQARIPTETIEAKIARREKPLVIVLPGMGDTLRVLRNSDIAKAIQDGMPDADIMLIEMTLAYYMEGRAVQRLHDEVIQPARQRGVRDIYLAGASLGGMGVLMYEREHPNDARGLILMAPFMGDQSLIKEIEAAGGLANWNPGPSPAQMNRDNVPREEWRVVQSWLTHPERARNVWLICGQSDRFYRAAEIIAAPLPSPNVVALPGGHGWKVWTKGAQQIFSQIGANRG
jgi:hypothetical protein